MAVEKFTDLQVWREAHQLVLRVYEITRKFPTNEKFGLVSPMRRAALSIPANIAEGFKRRGLQAAQWSHRQHRTPQTCPIVPTPYSPTPYSLQGADAVERWFKEKEVEEVVAFANRMAIQ